MKSRGALYFCLILLFSSMPSFANDQPGGLFLTVNDLPIKFPLFSLFVLPGEKLTLLASNDPANVEIKASVVLKAASGVWYYQVPDTPGIYPVNARNKVTQQQASLNIIVLEPFSSVSDGRLNGYKIGEYPEPRKNRANYTKPKGFIAVTKSNVDTQLTPHFTLRQFLCKQQSDYPKYLVLQENLLFLLEDLLVEVRQDGFDIETFGFISAYRTPFYNKQIKNVKYSRHIYGDAVDIFIDREGDGRLSDLNADGTTDRRDSKLFFDIANRFKQDHADERYTGGLGVYGRTTRHSGFIHVDTRGYKARW